MNYLLSPKGFLAAGGIVLVLVAILGMIGVIGPLPENSIFGATWWFDSGENWGHLVLGVLALLSAFWLSANLQKNAVLILGIVGVLVGLYSLVISASFLGANLENPADTLLHLVVGAWALWAFFANQERAPMTA